MIQPKLTKISNNFGRNVYHCLTIKKFKKQEIRNFPTQFRLSHALIQ
jgi:hypothetical protein